MVLTMFFNVSPRTWKDLILNREILKVGETWAKDACSRDLHSLRTVYYSLAQA